MERWSIGVSARILRSADQPVGRIGFSDFETQMVDRCVSVGQGFGDPVDHDLRSAGVGSHAATPGEALTLTIRATIKGD